MGIADDLSCRGFAVVEAGSGGSPVGIVSPTSRCRAITTASRSPCGRARPFPHIKLIIVSGAASGAVSPEVLGEEGTSMSKPYQYDVIAARIEQLLAGFGGLACPPVNAYAGSP
jgi:hypothetical protein